MKLFQALTFGRIRSFRSRLLAFAALTSAVAALLICVALVTTQQFRTQALVADHLESNGTVIALDLATTLTFDVPADALDALKSLAVVDHLAAAHVFDADGRLFVSRNFGSSQTLPSVVPMPQGMYRQADWLVHHTPITLGDQYLGTLVLVYDPSWITAAMWFNIGTAVLITIFATAVAMLFAVRLQRALAYPIGEIISTSRIVSETGDYSVTARRYDEDELGELTDAFNAMLTRIERQSTEVGQANERFRVAVEASPNGMVMVDENGRIVLVNETTERLFGYTRDELLGQRVEMLVPVRLREKHPVHRDSFYAHPQSREMGAGRDLHGLRKNGTEFPVEIGLNPIPTEEGLRVLSAIVDITERKRAEAELRDREQRLTTLTNAVPAFVWSADAQGRTRDLNDQWFEYTGTIRTHPLDESATAAIHPDDRQRTNECWEEARSEGKQFEKEMRIRGCDGQYRWFLARAVPLRDDDGKIVGWFGTTTDIEDRKRAEAERDALLSSERAARSDAEHASRMKDEFVATLSHELRTPLTAILGWAQMLKRRDTQDEIISEGLDTIERNARIQTQIIEDLLDMSRIVSGKIRLDVQLVELPDIIDAAIGTVRPAAESKGIRLQKIIDSRVAPVHGDPNRLQQIVWNLLSNAVKFTPRGGRVQVALQRINSHIEINVSDTGEGISPEFLPHLFERFRQADASTTRVHAGLGIGLALVKHLAELHGGTARAASPGKDQGATFTIALPLAIMHPPSGDDELERVHPTRSISRYTLASEASGLDGVRVMVIEDERDARVFIERLLQSANAEVRSSASAAKALDEISDFKPDVIISDIGMPGMDGYQFIRELRGRSVVEGGRVPAVALTAFARSEDRTRALVAGYQMHVAKPVEPAELLATVASLASQNRQE